MSAPILARLARSAKLARQSVGALFTGPAGPVGSIQDFHGAGFFAGRKSSPQEVRLILEQAAAGNLPAQWDLFAMMEDTWPRLAKNLAELRRSAARASYAVQPYAVRGAKPTETAKARAALVDEAIRQWWPRPGTLELSFEDTLFDALDAYGKGTAVLELHWHATEDGIVPRCSHLLAPRRYGWNAAGNELGLLTGEGAGWAPFPEDHFLVGMWRARSGAPGATAVLRALAPYWIGVTYGWEWLLSTAQLFGVPFRWATFDKSQPGIGAQLSAMLGQMGSAGYAAFPDGTKLNFVEAGKTSSDNPQVVIQALADKACDLLILGQELSGGAQAAGLGGGAAGLQGGVRADRLQAAAQWCADLLNYQLVPAILRANWGDTSEPPHIVADVDDEPDPLKLAERDKVLLDAGIQLPRSWFYERHGIPEPVDGEETITGRAQPAPGGFGAPALPAIANTPPPDAIAAKATATGTEAIFQANAAAATLAARRPVFRDLAQRLAQLSAATDDAARATLAAKFKADSAQLYGAIVKAEPALAETTANIIGTALLSGFADAAAAKPVSK